MNRFLATLASTIPVLGACAAGYGKTPGIDSGFDKCEVVSQLVSQLGSLPVIISPSMSGGFSLPYLFTEPGCVLQKARAYVPVAPVGSRNFIQAYPSAKVSTRGSMNVNCCGVCRGLKAS